MTNKSNEGNLAMIPYVVFEAEKYRAQRRENWLLAACALFATLALGGGVACLLRRNGR